MGLRIREIHHDYLPLKEGIRLAYRAWIPEDAAHNPVPAILEFLPYRKNDGTIYRDEITMPATASQGYACVRVDLRGTGESDGLFDDEYSEQEHSDAEEVIDWLSRQPWCNGRVGMVGISWGGFNALQLAFRQPPALKAIITICSTDDRFNEDIHFAGGCLLNDNLDWAAFFWAYAQARCPDPRLVGGQWRRQWLERLEHMPFLADQWIARQHKDKYWRHGSVSESYDRINIPVYAMGGWADAYRNTVFRLLENLSAPCKGLIGPWAHKYPHIAYPAPRIDYVRESVRWWDRWLKGIDNGIMEEPRLHYYLMDSVRPALDYEVRSGCWQSEPGWPSAQIAKRRLYLHDDKLCTTAQEQARVVEVFSPESVGKMAGKLMVGIGHEQEFPADQRQDDEVALSLDTDPLSEAVNIVGQPILRVTLACDKPAGNLIARLCDVHPCGESTLVTYGVLNLTHRDSHESPEVLIPGEPCKVALALHHIAYRIPANHRLRLSLSNAYWPLLWPSPHRDTLAITLSSSYLELPVKAVLQRVDNPALAPLEVSQEVADIELRAPMTCKRDWEDAQSGMLHIETSTDYGHSYYASCASEIDFSVTQHTCIHPADPLSARYASRHQVRMQQGDVYTRLEAHYEMTCSSSDFFISASWRAWEGENCIFEKQFDHTIPRRLL